MISIVIRLWENLTSQRRTHFILFLFLTFIGSLVEVISLGAVIPFLAALTNPEEMLVFPVISDVLFYFNLTNNNQIMLTLTIMFAGAAVFAGSIRLLILFVGLKLSFMSVHDLSVKIYYLTLTQPYETHLDRNSSEIIAGITSKASTVSNVLQSVVTLINATLLIVLIIIALVILEPMIALISALGFGSIYLTITFFINERLRVNSENIANASTQSVKALQEGLNGIRDIILDKSEHVYCSIYNKADLQLKKSSANNMFMSVSPKSLIESLGMVVIASVALSLSGREGGIINSIPLLGALALGAQRLMPALQQVFSTWATIAGCRAPVLDVLDLLDQPIQPSVKLTNNSEKIVERSIKLKDVGFKYASSKRLSLSRVNINFTRGKKIAFVGGTGSGKSTIIDIIMGLLRPTKGDVIIDGIALRDRQYGEWQSHIAHVPQRIYLTDATIAENIAFGIPADEIDQKLLKSVMVQAQLLDFVNNSPEGWNTKVGEFGCSLSGGQVQRIGIARALYKKASILILDEATSALDGLTERMVMNAISQSNKGITLILITHRLSIIKDCDIIYEVESGRIVAKGTYNELIQSSASFQKMVTV
jgi:ATP-binding cassette, subfamily B, bacterial PglK